MLSPKHYAYTPLWRHCPKTWRPALAANRHTLKKLLIVYIYGGASIVSKALLPVIAGVKYAVTASCKPCSDSALQRATSCIRHFPVIGDTPSHIFTVQKYNHFLANNVYFSPKMIPKIQPAAFLAFVNNSGIRRRPFSNVSSV